MVAWCLKAKAEWLEVSNSEQKVNRGAAGGWDMLGSPVGAVKPTDSRTRQGRAEGASWLCQASNQKL